MDEANAFEMLADFSIQVGELTRKNAIKVALSQFVLQATSAQAFCEFLREDDVLTLVRDNNLDTDIKPLIGQKIPCDLTSIAGATALRRQIIVLEDAERDAPTIGSRFYSLFDDHMNVHTGSIMSLVVVDGVVQVSRTRRSAHCAAPFTPLDAQLVIQATRIADARYMGLRLHAEGLATETLGIAHGFERHAAGICSAAGADRARLFLIVDKHLVYSGEYTYLTQWGQPIKPPDRRLGKIRFPIDRTTVPGVTACTERRQLCNKSISTDVDAMLQSYNQAIISIPVWNDGKLAAVCELLRSDIHPFSENQLAMCEALVEARMTPFVHWARTERDVATHAAAIKQAIPKFNVPPCSYLARVKELVELVGSARFLSEYVKLLSEAAVLRDDVGRIWDEYIERLCEQGRVLEIDWEQILGISIPGAATSQSPANKILMLAKELYEKRHIRFDESHDQARFDDVYIVTMVHDFVNRIEQNGNDVEEACVYIQSQRGKKYDHLNTGILLSYKDRIMGNGFGRCCD